MDVSVNVSFCLCINLQLCLSVFICCLCVFVFLWYVFLGGVLLTFWSHNNLSQVAVDKPGHRVVGMKHQTINFAEAFADTHCSVTTVHAAWYLFVWLFCRRAHDCCTPCKHASMGPHAFEMKWHDHTYTSQFWWEDRASLVSDRLLLLSVF